MLNLEGYVFYFQRCNEHWGVYQMSRKDTQYTYFCSYLSGTNPIWLKNPVDLQNYY